MWALRTVNIELSVPSPARPARPELRQSFLYVVITSIAIVERGLGGIAKLRAVSSSPEFRRAHRRHG